MSQRDGLCHFIVIVQEYFFIYPVPLRVCIYIYISVYIFLLPFQLSIEGESWTCRKYELSFHKADTNCLRYQVSCIKSSKEITEFYFWKRCRAEPWLVVHIWGLIEMLICKIFCVQWCVSSVQLLFSVLRVWPELEHDFQTKY